MSFSTDDEHVTVRMYNVGFGDSFLLAFPGPERSSRVLVDCGTHNASPRPRPIGEVVSLIVEAVRDDDGVPRIDLVVGTHRHRDHVSGFENELWEEVEVGEVWMPWTEHPTDPEARRIRERQSKAATRLHATFLALGADPSLVQLAENQLTNAGAMTTLHRGFQGDPERQFLSGPHPEPLETDLLPGVRVHVLGPSRDPEVIRDMDPPAGESYFRLGQGGDGAARVLEPFGADWSFTPAELAAKGLEHLGIEERDVERLTELGDPDLFGIAVSLEKAVNGTSLMLAFEVGDAMLLFPGDAQWGTWRCAIDDEAANAVLARTTFLKVGHHGSHNATPRDFLEDVLGPHLSALEQPAELRAMVSTHPVEQWKFIPKQELLEALRTLSEMVARSDESDPAAPGFTYEGDFFVEARVAL